MKADIMESPVSKPLHHDGHQSPCDTAAPKCALGVHIQNRSSSRLGSTGMPGPSRNDDPSACNYLGIISLCKPTAVRAVSNCRLEVCLRRSLHCIKRGRIAIAHVLEHSTALT